VDVTDGAICEVNGSSLSGADGDGGDHHYPANQGHPFPLYVSPSPLYHFLTLTPTFILGSLSLQYCGFFQKNNNNIITRGLMNS